MANTEGPLRWYRQAFDTSEGPATRLQWGASYLVALVDLAPGDAARIEKTADSANPRYYNDIRTNGVNQRGNPNGHIIRWRETLSEPSATTFAWDVYLFGARATQDASSLAIIIIPVTVYLRP